MFFLVCALLAVIRTHCTWRIRGLPIARLNGQILPYYFIGFYFCNDGFGFAALVDYPRFVFYRSVHSIIIFGIDTTRARRTPKKRSCSELLGTFCTENLGTNSVHADKTKLNKTKNKQTRIHLGYDSRYNASRKDAF